ncbi:MAG: hypothetical protein DMG15_04465 [Acidobacteria bacterium]|nr:MAG: hypothetical protein DMG16_27635 [Acidobacteriota bacterium]PYS15643.1 MAG: hypothetical protein DMG15_04465 [Acidobacteriota bacterium]
MRAGDAGSRFPQRDIASFTPIGSVYITLDRLEDKGHLASKPGRPPQWGGQARRYYGLPAAGQRALRQAFETSRRLQQTAEPLWEFKT